MKISFKIDYHVKANTNPIKTYYFTFILFAGGIY